MLTYRVLSCLLSYPEADLQRAVPELRAALDGEALLPTDRRAALEPLLAALETGELMDVQEAYVRLFDRSRALSLHLFEHVHGESRDRGQALVDLGTLYADRGLDPVDGELPDFLPLFLEFLSLLPDGEARALLAEPAHVLEALRRRLAERDSPYAAIFAALLALTAAPDRAVVDELTAVPADAPDDPDQLDRAWEETAVTFGPGAPTAGCPQARDLLARMAPPR